MIKHGDKNIFESKMQTIANTVNCVGVMGKGIALDFKRLYPEMFIEYQGLCKQKKVKLGKPYLYRGLFLPWILNFPTKNHWKDKSDIQDIHNGLVYLRENYKKMWITSLALPALGCGNGGLDWPTVEEEIYRTLDGIDIDVEIYTPAGWPRIPKNEINMRRL